MAKANYTCIVCPISCRITVEETPEGLKISGHTCKRGETFAENEHTNPMRMLTSTVVIEGAEIPRLPVISEAEIPKSKMKDCLAEIYRTKVKAPITCGDVIIPAICGTGVNIVASRSMDAVSR